jgi:glyoxylase-like metal-dependent hydrolase (beta-lactamase superfamily II)
MTYTGRTAVGEVPQRRELVDIDITKIAVGPMNNNCYILRCRATGDTVVIDAAAEASVILKNCPPTGVKAVVTTHSHADHWQALAEVVAATNAVTYAGTLDADGIPIPTTHRVSHLDSIPVGNTSLQAVHLKGHTPGSIALIHQDSDSSWHVFTGDCLFPGGVGNTGNDPERFVELLSDVEQELFDRLPDEAWVYPGHGDDTTIGAERPHLAEWRSRGW